MQKSDVKPHACKPVVPLFKIDHSCEMDVIEIFNRMCYRYAGETRQDFKMGWVKVVKIVVRGEGKSVEAK
jgi:hypothetical protein